MEDLQASNKRLNSKLKETKEDGKKAMEVSSTKSSVQAVGYRLFIIVTSVDLTEPLLAVLRSSTELNGRSPIWRMHLAKSDRACVQLPPSRRGLRRTRSGSLPISAGLKL